MVWCSPAVPAAAFPLPRCFPPPPTPTKSLVSMASPAARCKAHRAAWCTRQHGAGGSVAHSVHATHVRLRVRAHTRLACSPAQQQLLLLLHSCCHAPTSLPLRLGWSGRLLRRRAAAAIHLHGGAALLLLAAVEELGAKLICQPLLLGLACVACGMHAACSCTGRCLPARAACLPLGGRGAVRGCTAHRRGHVQAGAATHRSSCPSLLALLGGVGLCFTVRAAAAGVKFTPRRLPPADHTAALSAPVDSTTPMPPRKRRAQEAEAADEESEPSSSSAAETSGSGGSGSGGDSSSSDGGGSGGSDGFPGGAGPRMACRPAVRSLARPQARPQAQQQPPQQGRLRLSAVGCPGPCLPPHAAARAPATPHAPPQRSPPPRRSLMTARAPSSRS